MSDYMQLTQEERYQIYILKKAEYSQAQIAKLLGRDKSTISRELRRNRGLKGYRPQQAHNLALARRNDKAQPRIDSQVWQQVEALIREQWSPEQIVGRIAMEPGVSAMAPMTGVAASPTRSRLMSARPLSIANGTSVTGRVTP